MLKIRIKGTVLSQQREAGVRQLINSSDLKT